MNTQQIVQQQAIAKGGRIIKALREELANMEKERDDLQEQVDDYGEPEDLAAVRDELQEQEIGTARGSRASAPWPTRPSCTQEGAAERR